MPDMFYPSPFKKAKFLRRYKRFFADIEVRKETLTAHCPNTGSMKSCLKEGGDCYYTLANNPKRKLQQTLEAIHVGSSWVGVHTHKANKIVGECILPLHSKYKKYQHIFSEVKISDKSRADFVLSKSFKTKPKIKDIKGDDFLILEVKNVSLVEDGVASFPDAVSTRGQKHIQELREWLKKGVPCELLFLIQRSDFDYFSPAEHIDEKYAKLLREAKKEGLRIHAYIVDVEPKGYRVREKTAKLKI